MRNLRLISLLAVFALVLAACAPGDGGQPTETGPAATEPGAAGDGAQEACEADEFGCIEIAEGEPIQLGTALSITGDTASLGLDSQYGAQVAADFKSEEGGVLGHEVELVNEDAGCAEAEDGQTAAQALVANETIVAVIGTTCSTTAVPAGPVLGEQGVVLISPSNTAPGLTNPEHEQYAGEFYMRTAHNDKIQGAAMATFVCEELQLSTAATVHDGSPYADQLQQVFAEEFANQCDGELTTDPQAVAPTDTQFSAVLETVAAGSPEFFYYPIFHPAGTLLTQQAREFPGLEETVLAGADGLLVADLLDQAAAEAEGMYLSGPDLAFSGEFYEGEFLPAYTEVSGEEEPTSVFHAHAHDAANMIFDAIEAVGIDEGGTLFIPRTALRDELFATSGFEGITGTLTCDEFGDCADARISVSQVQSGEFVRIWPEE